MVRRKNENSLLIILAIIGTQFKFKMWCDYSRYPAVATKSSVSLLVGFKVITGAAAISVTIRIKKAIEIYCMHESNFFAFVHRISV